ncbi:hypothetical protein [Granulicella arctica]|uniref:hypothetical protein n=1 Tax=Granulicella arctica TaxID=940613 RepID=UPI0021E0969C|nr:hypothetical protein [Granulicella arctica]
MAFASTWSAEMLAQPPMIAPARQFTYPLQVAGEEDALARGALLLMVKPAVGETFLATCALGFTSASMPTGVFACPKPDEMCAVAGGYAYVVDTLAPAGCTHLSLKPVTEVRVLEAEGLLLFVGFHALIAWGENGLAWQTDRLSWEGLQLGAIENGLLHGSGWNLMTDKDVGFTVDLQTGKHVGGGYP